MLKTPRYEVLFFIDGPMPTPEQSAHARSFGPHVKFRNARFAPPGSGLEPCTAVFGSVPKDYRDAYPIAVSYDDWFAGKLPTVANPGPSRMGMLDTNVQVGMKPTRILGVVPPPAAPIEGTGATPIPGLTEAPDPFELPAPPPAFGSPSGPPPAASHGRLSARQREALAKTGNVFGEKETA